VGRRLGAHALDQLAQLGIVVGQRRADLRERVDRQGLVALVRQVADVRILC
jgi:hypothetical protein